MAIEDYSARDKQQKKKISQLEHSATMSNKKQGSKKSHANLPKKIAPFGLELDRLGRIACVTISPFGTKTVFMDLGFSSRPADVDPNSPERYLNADTMKRCNAAEYFDLLPEHLRGPSVKYSQFGDIVSS